MSSDQLNERELTILHHWNGGLSAHNIMKAVRCNDRTLRKIVAKLEAMGLACRPALRDRLALPFAWPPERIQALREMHAKGLTYTAIGESLGVSRGSVSGMCKRLGLVRDEYTSLRNRRVANVGNTALLRQMNEARRGKPALHLRGPRGPRLTFNVKPLGERLPPKVITYQPSEAELSASKSLMELGPFHCRFPISDAPEGLSDGMRFCGCIKKSNKPYCEAHFELTHVQQPQSVESFMRSLRKWAA